MNNTCTPANNDTKHMTLGNAIKALRDLAFTIEEAVETYEHNMDDPENDTEGWTPDEDFRQWLRNQDNSELIDQLIGLGLTVSLPE